MQESKNKDLLIHVILFIFVAGLIGAYFFLLKDLREVKDTAGSQISTQTAYLPGNCDEACRKQIENELAARLGSATPVGANTPTATPKAVLPAITPRPASGTKTTTYVPFSGSFSTTATDWTDDSGNQAYVDLKNNYSATAYVTFEASIRVPGGGVVFARLFDSTHGIAVDGSEISTSSSSSTLVSSGKLNLWSGNNLYKVQIKSLNSFNVTFDSGRIKLVY